MGGQPRPLAQASWEASLKVLVDTSAWVDFLSGHPSKEAAALASLIASDDEICTCGRDRDLTTILGNGLLKARLLVVPEAM